MRPISTTRSTRDEFGGDLTLNFQIEVNLKDVLVDRVFAYVVRIMAKQCAGESDGE